MKKKLVLLLTILSLMGCHAQTTSEQDDVAFERYLKDKGINAQIFNYQAVWDIKNGKMYYKTMMAIEVPQDFIKYYYNNNKEK
jgi:uncharacterized lipoprotein NlpE involved in copper resistance